MKTKTFVNSAEAPRKRGSKAKWMTRGTFDCLTGQWKGRIFAVDPDLVYRVTEYAALHDCAATMRYQVRLDNSEGRITVAMAMAA